MAFSARYALVLAAVFFVQGHDSARHRRSTEAQTPLQELMDRAKVQLQGLTEEWNKLTHAANLDELKTLLTEKTKELEDRTKSVMDELKRQYEVHGAEFSERASAAVNEAATRLNTTLENLKAQAPGVMDEATVMHQNFTNAFKTTAETLFEETGKLAKAAGEDASSVHTALTNLSRSAMSQTLEVMQQMHNEIQEAVKRVTS